MPQDSKPDADADVTLGVVYQEPSGASEGHGAPDVAADLSFRYDLREMIARGGLGEVCTADDRTLGQRVAVKILQSRYHTGSAVANRFVDEARISGQLQHPGIPPIHDLGTLPDGRPFLAMKLIKGRTLDDLLHQRMGPGADRGRFIAVFEQVCQAVAYAHARRVIHRDLKPQNIMVGAFGEVQVMDWGLAKVLGRPTGQTRPSDSDDRMATEILSARDDSDGSQTQAGSVLGTPAYMAPEQAVGAVEQVDERSDVFGLGAVLAVILTGQPPYVGDNSETIRVLAARGKLDDCFARLDAGGAEPELVALCKSCLNPERDDRPSDAGAVARAIASFRAEAEERARQAELDRVRAEGDRARLEAESRAQRQKRRARRAVAVGALALLVVGASAALTIRNQAEGRRNDADRLASVALGRAEELAAQAGAIDPAELFEANAAVKLLEQAEAAVAQAESAVAGVGGADVRARAGEAARSVRSRLAGSRRDARLLAALENAEGADAGTAGGLIDDQEKRRLYHSAFEGAGLPAGGDPTTLAAAVRAERPGLRGALLKARSTGGNTSAFYRANPAVDRASGRRPDLVDGDPVRREIRAAIAGGCEALNRLAGRLSAARPASPPTAVLIGDALVLQCKSYRGERFRILQHAWEKSPSDRTLLRDLAWALSEGYPTDPVRIEESVGYARTLIALNPDNAVGHFVLGQILQYAKRDLKSAESQYRRTIALNPRFTLAMNNLGYILHDRGDVAGAEQLFRRTVEVDPGGRFLSRKILASLLRSEKVTWRLLRPSSASLSSSIPRTLARRGPWTACGGPRISCLVSTTSWPDGRPRPPRPRASSSLACAPCPTGANMLRPLASSTAPSPGTRSWPRFRIPRIDTTPHAPPSWPRSDGGSTPRAYRPSGPHCVGRPWPGYAPNSPSEPRRRIPTSLPSGRLPPTSCRGGSPTPTLPWSGPATPSSTSSLTSGRPGNRSGPTSARRSKPLRSRTRPPRQSRGHDRSFHLVLNQA